VFINNSIDGATAFLMLKWLSGNKKLQSVTVTKKSFRHIFTKWIANNNLDEYKRLYVINVDVSEFTDILPSDKLVVIDNNPNHVTNHYHKETTKLVYPERSCTHIIYEVFQSKFNVELTKQQKVLMLLVNDYASYSFSLKGSYELGLIFGNYQGDKAQKFCREFYAGFNRFLPEHQTIINFYKNKLNDIRDGLEVFSGLIPIGTKKYTVVGTFAGSFINEISDWLLEEYNGDISIVINLDDSKVSFRRKDDCKVDVGQLAKKLANGGGHKYSAGGFITNDLLTFSKFELSKYRAHV
jgi:hypothetical protein